MYMANSAQSFATIGSEEEEDDDGHFYYTVYEEEDEEDGGLGQFDSTSYMPRRFPRGVRS